MEIQKDETINQFVQRLESEAHERMALVATIRKMMPVTNTTKSLERIGRSRKTSRKLRHSHKTTLADQIADVLNESPRPLTQPLIRDALHARGEAQHLKNPLSAISTAMTRQLGKRFQRGNGYEWRLIGKNYELPMIDHTNNELALSG